MLENTENIFPHQKPVLLKCVFQEYIKPRALFVYCVREGFGAKNEEGAKSYI